jgi:hypothetical protein
VPPAAQGARPDDQARRREATTEETAGGAPLADVVALPRRGAPGVDRARRREDR